jgi:hypothetical protein
MERGYRSGEWEARIGGPSTLPVHFVSHRDQPHAIPGRRVFGIQTASGVACSALHLHDKVGTATISSSGNAVECGEVEYMCIYKATSIYPAFHPGSRFTDALSSRVIPLTATANLWISSSLHGQDCHGKNRQQRIHATPRQNTPKDPQH